MGMDSAPGKYTHGGNTQEKREQSYQGSNDRLKSDEKERINQLVGSLGVGMSGQELSELKSLMMRTGGSFEEQKKNEIWNKIESVEAEKKKA